MQNEQPLSIWDKVLKAYHGKHLAIVHQYLPPDDIRDVWYHQWGMGVISFLGTGFEVLGLRINMLDIESFLYINPERKKKYDYCLSLMCGNKDIAYWCITPSIAAWYGAKPLPVSADTIVAGERKDLGNLLAKESGFNVPTVYKPESPPDPDALVVIKPRDYGSSVGLHCGKYSELKEINHICAPKYIIQDYVSGTDVTVPVLYNPETNTYDVGRGVATYHTGHDNLWTFDDKAKSYARAGDVPDDVSILTIKIPNAIKRKIAMLVELSGGSPVARMDFRVKNFEIDTPVSEDDFYFIEINPVPTMTSDSQFTLAITDSIKRGELLNNDIVEAFAEQLKDTSLVSALIAYSMLRHADVTSTHSV